jgi:hypothetical protein
VDQPADRPAPAQVEMCQHPQSAQTRDGESTKRQKRPEMPEGESMKHESGKKTSFSLKYGFGRQKQKNESPN